MIEIDLKENEEEGIWFPFFTSSVDVNDRETIKYDDPIDPDVKVKIRSLKPFIEKLLKQDDKRRKSEFVPHPKTREMQRVTYIPEKSMAEKVKDTDDMHVYAIMDWEGFKIKGTDLLIEVNDINKVKLSKNPQFSRFFDRCQEILRNDEVVRKEEEEKN